MANLGGKAKKHGRTTRKQKTKYPKHLKSCKMHERFVKGLKESLSHVHSRATLWSFLCSDSGPMIQRLPDKCAVAAARPFLPLRLLAEGFSWQCPSSHTCHAFGQMNGAWDVGSHHRHHRNHHLHHHYVAAADHRPHPEKADHRPHPEKGQLSRCRSKAWRKPVG